MTAGRELAYWHGQTSLAEGRILRERIEAQLAKIKTMPNLVRSFFRAPSVAYIGDY